jgi:hypothetical protein
MSIMAKLDEMADERRFPNNLRVYWNKKRGSRSFPAEQDIDPDDLGLSWEYCFLVQVRDILNVQDYNYTYLGEGIIRAYRGEIFDEHNESMIGPNAHALGKSFRKVMETKAPMMEDGEFTSLMGRRIKYRQCMLPVGDSDDAVEAIFGGISFTWQDEAAGI